MNLLLYEFRKRGLVHSATWKALVSMLNEKKKQVQKTVLMQVGARFLYGMTEMFQKLGCDDGCTISVNLLKNH